MKRSRLLQQKPPTPRQKRHGSREPRPCRAKRGTDRARSKPRLRNHRFFSITPPLTRTKRPPRAQRASGRSAVEKKNRRAKPCGGNPESILFYLSYPYAGFGQKIFFDHAVRIPGGEGAKAPQRSEAVFPPTRDAAGKGAQKAQPRPLATPMHQKRNALSQERSFYSISAFFCLARKASPFLSRTSNVSSFRACDGSFLPFVGRGGRFFFLSDVRRRVSSFRTARREFFFLSGGLAGVFLPYSGFLSIAA